MDRVLEVYEREERESHYTIQKNICIIILTTDGLILRRMKKSRI